MNIPTVPYSSKKAVIFIWHLTDLTALANIKTQRPPTQVYRGLCLLNDEAEIKMP
jgi:hypothetical protein